MSVAFWEDQVTGSHCSSAHHPPFLMKKKKKTVIPRINEMGKGVPVHSKTNYSRCQGLDPGCRSYYAGRHVCLHFTNGRGQRAQCGYKADATTECPPGAQVLGPLDPALQTICGRPFLYPAPDFLSSETPRSSRGPFSRVNWSSKAPNALGRQQWTQPIRPSGPSSKPLQHPRAQGTSNHTRLIARRSPIFWGHALPRTLGGARARGHGGSCGSRRATRIPARLTEKARGDRAPKPSRRAAGRRRK